MSRPKYATVKNYATKPIGGEIVEAVPVEGFDLTGLVVDVDPEYWNKIDALESGYDRIKVQTMYGEAWMYAKPN